MILEAIPSSEKETNPWVSAEARFDEAAELLGLDEGLRKILRIAGAGAEGQRAGDAGRRPLRSLHRLSRAAFHRARAGQGRHPLRARRDARRSAGARRPG